MAARYSDPVPTRRRALALALTVALHLLLVWALTRIGPFVDMAPEAGTALSTFDVASERTPSPQPRRERQQERPRATPQRTAPPRAEPERLTPLPSNIIWLTRDQYRATDLARLPNRPRAEQGAELAEAGPAGGAGSGEGGGPTPIGTGPDGKPMYAARWQREPSNAELRPYIPARTPPDAWGMIACRTVAGFRVDDCQTLGEEPRGTGLATGVRRAAWQFRVVPPMRGREPMLGVWVRIRIEFSARGADAGG